MKIRAKTVAKVFVEKVLRIEGYPGDEQVNHCTFSELSSAIDTLRYAVPALRKVEIQTFGKGATLRIYDFSVAARSMKWQGCTTEALTEYITAEVTQYLEA